MITCNNYDLIQLCVYVQVNCFHNNYYVVTVFMYCCNVCVYSCDLNNDYDGEEGGRGGGREGRGVKVRWRGEG